MSFKRKNFILRNKQILIFLSLYIIGVIFSTVFIGDTNGIEESVKAGIEKINEDNMVYSAIRLALNFFSVSLTMWSFLVIMSSYRIISWLGISVSFFVGYSAGYSSLIILRTMPSQALKYIMLCIAPAAIMRMLLWYVVYKFCVREITDKRKEKNRCYHLLNMLIVILLSDVMISTVSVIFSGILF